jgi:hypothetical protein
VGQQREERGKRFFRWFVALTILAAVIFGAVEAWTAARIHTATTAASGAAAKRRDVAPAVVATEALPPQPTMPSGWRDLKFGMSEKEVTALINGYRVDATIPWKQSDKTATTYLPTVRLGARAIDYVAVDEKRYHHFSIRELDEGTETLEAWHDRGALIAIQFKGRAEPTAFFDRATEAYAARPQSAKFKFFDDRTKMQQPRELSFWRGTDMTAFLWTSGNSPIFLLWSNAAMATREAEFQASIDAPASALKKAQKAGETGTKF